LSFLAAAKPDLSELTKKILYGEIKLTASLDRASDSDADFLPLAEKLPYFHKSASIQPQKQNMPVIKPVCIMT